MFLPTPCLIKKESATPSRGSANIKYLNPCFPYFQEFQYPIRKILEILLDISIFFQVLMGPVVFIEVPVFFSIQLLNIFVIVIQLA